MSYSASFWEVTEFFKPYDLIIVGAGIVGLSSAYFYKKAHPADQVLVVDKGFIPEGASTKNAGFACFGSVTEITDDLKTESEEEVKARIKKRFDGLALLRNVLGDEEIGYQMCGGYEIFDDQRIFSQAASQVDRFNKWLEDITWESNVYSITEVNGYPAIFNRLEGALNTGKMMKRLLKKVRDRGIEIRWNCPVQEIKSQQIKINDHFTLESEKILVATNGFVRQLLPDIMVKPARGYAFVTNEFEKLSWKGTFHFDKGYVYFRDIGDRLLLGGARNLDFHAEETSLFAINENIKNWLIHFANDKLKLERNWNIDYEWTGIMGFAGTKTLEIRQLNDHLYVAAGLGGMGVAIGMQVGRDAFYLMEENI